MKRIGLIGAGAMGQGIALQLQRAGYPVLVHKRTLDAHDKRQQELLAAKVELSDSLTDLFSRSEILITCLPDSPVVEEILIGPNSLLTCVTRNVSVVLDFSTALPESTRRIATTLAKVGVEMLDTPMSGGPSNAHRGTLKIAVGGKRELFEEYLPLLEIVGNVVVYAGAIGSGHVLKLFNNFLGFLGQVATAGVDVVREREGISRQALIDFITPSGGSSVGFTAMTERLKNNSFDLFFALNLAHKDLRYCQELFRNTGDFGLLDELVEQFQTAVREGYGEQDLGTIYHSVRNGLMRNN